MSERPRQRRAPQAEPGAVRAARVILAVPRLSRAENARGEGWVTNGIFYPRASTEALGRLAMVIRMKQRWESVDLRLGHDAEQGRPGLRIWWRPRNNYGTGRNGEGCKRSGPPRLAPEVREARAQARRELTAQRQRERTAARRAANVCIDCAGERDGKHIYCPKCRAKRNAYNARRADMRKRREAR